MAARGCPVGKFGGLRSQHRCPAKVTRTAVVAVAISLLAVACGESSRDEGTRAGGPPPSFHVVEPAAEQIARLAASSYSIAKDRLSRLQDRKAVAGLKWSCENWSCQIAGSPRWRWGGLRGGCRNVARGRRRLLPSKIVLLEQLLSLCAAQTCRALEPGDGAFVVLRHASLALGIKDAEV